MAADATAKGSARTDGVAVTRTPWMISPITARGGHPRSDSLAKVGADASGVIGPASVEAEREPAVQGDPA